MGLDSIPPIDFSDTQMPLRSISRSRSMNSVETGREFEPKQGRHRRVKTSLPFREAPEFLELEEENFFVLSFENSGETKPSSRTKKKNNVNFGESKTRKTENSLIKNNKRDSIHEKKENQEPNTRISPRTSQKVRDNCKVRNSNNVLCDTKNYNGNPSKSNSHREVSDRRKSRLKKKEKECCSVAKIGETESDPENASPVSVLDFDEFITNSKLSPSEEALRLTNSNFRRKLSKQLQDHEQPTPGNAANEMNNDQANEVAQVKGRGLKKRDYQSQDYAEMWREICKLAEEDVRASNWGYVDAWKHKDLQVIAVDLGFQIYEALLNEFVDQLAGTSHEKGVELLDYKELSTVFFFHNLD